MTEAPSPPEPFIDKAAAERLVRALDVLPLPVDVTDEFREGFETARELSMALILGAGGIEKDAG